MGGLYPWRDPDPSSPDYESEMDQNYMAANIGQLKYLFSWSLVGAPNDPDDIDSDGIKDWWEYMYFGNLSTAGNGTNYNGDGISDLEKFNNGIDPTLPPSGSGLHLVVYTPMER